MTRTWFCKSCQTTTTSSPSVGARFCANCGHRCVLAPSAEVLHADAMAKAWDIEQTIRAWNGWARPVVEA